VIGSRVTVVCVNIKNGAQNSGDLWPAGRVLILPIGIASLKAPSCKYLSATDLQWAGG